jgi:hypothetical protein
MIKTEQYVSRNHVTQEIYFYILIKDLTHNEQTYTLNLFKGKHVKKENE